MLFLPRNVRSTALAVLALSALLAACTEPSPTASQGPRARTEKITPTHLLDPAHDVLANTDARKTDSAALSLQTEKSTK